MRNCAGAHPHASFKLRDYITARTVLRRAPSTILQAGMRYECHASLPTHSTSSARIIPAGESRTRQGLGITIVQAYTLIYKPRERACRRIHALGPFTTRVDLREGSTSCGPLVPCEDCRVTVLIWYHKPGHFLQRVGMRARSTNCGRIVQPGRDAPKSAVLRAGTSLRATQSVHSFYSLQEVSRARKQPKRAPGLVLRDSMLSTHQADPPDIILQA